MATSASATLEFRPPLSFGRAFVSPWFDALVIAGGLSLVATAVLWLAPSQRAWISPESAVFPWTLIVCQYAHFGASTVRLYSQPQASSRWPFLTLVLPIASLAAVVLIIWQSDLLVRNASSFYLTWSPYHYAAQAYGLSLMYSYRSGCRVEAGDKRLWRWVSLCPFLLNFMGSPNVGLQWLVPAEWFHGRPFFQEGVRWSVAALQVLSVAGPLVLFARLRSRGQQLPFLALLILLSNGLWFVVLHPMNAFFVATAGHSLQYLAIAMIYHVRERKALPGDHHGAAFHALSFYAKSALLGYALFSVMPFGLYAAGAGFTASVLAMLAVINVHHFIVDAYIWRLSGGNRNRSIAEAGAAPA